MGNGVWNPPVEIKTDRVVITVKAEQNSPPEIHFSNDVQYSEERGYYIECDIDYTSDPQIIGCSYILPTQIEPFLSQAIDPEGDPMTNDASGWYNDENLAIELFDLPYQEYQKKD